MLLVDIRSNYCEHTIPKTYTQPLLIRWGQFFQTGAKTATNFRKTIKRLKMVYFITLCCWLTLGATIVNITYQKHTHNHFKPDGGNFSKRGRKPPQISEKLFDIRSNYCEHNIPKTYTQPLLTRWGQIFQTGAKTATNFRKPIKRLKMVYFTTLYCWLTLGATTVNIPYQKHTHNHS